VALEALWLGQKKKGLGEGETPTVIGARGSPFSDPGSRKGRGTQNEKNTFEGAEKEGTWLSRKTWGKGKTKQGVRKPLNRQVYKMV